MNLVLKDRLIGQLFEHATESIIVINREGCITLVNPATEKLFGYSQEDFMNKQIEFLMPDRYASRHTRHRDDFFENPHPRAMGIGMDLFAKKKNSEEFPVEISLSPFNTDGHMFTIAFIIDISKRKLAEQEMLQNQEKLKVMTEALKSTNEKLETKVQDRTKVLQEALNEIEKSRAELIEALEKEKELNELKSRFLSMASHEFRTPLTTILSSASLIPEYPAGDQQEKRMRHVQRIQSAVNNLNDILSDFLSLSKIEEGKVSASNRLFNLKELAQEVCNEMKAICKNGQIIQYTHQGKEEIELDPKLLRNILINLLSNAIKFSEENKSIYLQTKCDSNYIFVEIKDEGMGISHEDQQHLFERFFRGHNATNIQGTGLGLSIVAKYLELMNGEITMESEIEKGTLFKIKIPKKNN